MSVYSVHLSLKTFAAKYSFANLFVTAKLKASKHLWQVMKLDATEATMHTLFFWHIEKLLRITENGIKEDAQYFWEYREPTIEHSCLWMLHQDVGFIMLSTCPFLFFPTWNTQALWLPPPPWHKLSIRPFESNSPASHLYFHNSLSPEFEEHSPTDQFYLSWPPLISKDEEISLLVKQCMHIQLSARWQAYKLLCI